MKQDRHGLRQRSLIIIAVLLVIWPPVYSLFIHAHVVRVFDPTHPSTADLQQLLDARRYTVHVPPDRNGWRLSLESVDGNETRSSGELVVHGSADVTILIRRARESNKVEYCLLVNGQSVRGFISDPISVCDGFTHRTSPNTRPGDWLLSGQFATVSDTDHNRECGIRVLLRPPTDA